MSDGTLPWDSTSAAPASETIKVYADVRGVHLDVPRGASLIGCRNCRASDRLRHPELGMVYCYTCSVEIRRRARVR